MKRLYSSTFSSCNQTEIAMKRERSDVPSLSTFLEINNDDESTVIPESIPLVDSLIEQDNDFIEILYDTINSRCQHIDSTLTVILDSDSDDEQNVDVVNDDSLLITQVITPVIASSSIGEFDGTIEYDDTNLMNVPELIDLTEDETESIKCSSNKLENDSSPDLHECPICLETFSDLQNTGVYLFITECSHVMCTVCSRQSLAISPRCPLCRTNLSSTTLKPYCILT